MKIECLSDVQEPWHTSASFHHKFIISYTIWQYSKQTIQNASARNTDSNFQIKKSTNINFNINCKFYNFIDCYFKMCAISFLTSVICKLNCKIFLHKNIIKKLKIYILSKMHVSCTNFREIYQKFIFRKDKMKLSLFPLSQ